MEKILLILKKIFKIFFRVRIKKSNFRTTYLSKEVSNNIQKFSDPLLLGKASNSGTFYIERFREIISDPINILIKKVPEAGYVDKNNYVILHNGNRVPIRGDLSYYDKFSDILILNRGVHEPLEEYCFQEMLTKIKIKSPIMVELGSYWAHYSMWLKKKIADSRCYLVEPDLKNLECGKNNFMINNFKGEFINDMIQPLEKGLTLDKFFLEKKLISINILHADIQGFEINMIEGAKFLLKNHIIEYIFISTHSEDLHNEVVKKLNEFKYNIEISSGFENHTTSCDGFIFASSPKSDRVFKSFFPLGRVEILKSSPEKIIEYIKSISN